MQTKDLSTPTEDLVNDVDLFSTECTHQLFSRRDAHSLVRNTTSPDHLVALFKQVLAAGPKRDLIPVPQNYLELCKDLADRFPNFAKYIAEYLVPDLALERIRNGAVTISPPLFVGPPGVGKTMFAEAFAIAFSLPFERINLEASQAAFELVGSSRGWSNPEVGRLFRKLVAAKIPTNALFTLDELDKARGDSRFPIAPVLLQLLEPSTSKQFTDQSAPELALDIRPTNFFFTANSLDGINEALLSRLVIVDIPALSRQEAARVVVNQYDTLVESLGLSMKAPTLTDEAITVLSTHSPRRQRVLLRLGIGRAIADGATKIALPTETLRGMKRMGFL